MYHSLGVRSDGTLWAWGWSTALGLAIHRQIKSDPGGHGHQLGVGVCRGRSLPGIAL